MGIAKTLTVAATLCGLGAMLSGCIVIASDKGTTRRVTVQTDQASVATDNRGEPVYGVWFDEKGLNARVSSNGCTDKDSFRLEVNYGATNTLTLVRTRPDMCRALIREGRVLTWSLKEVGIGAGVNVRLTNPVTSW